MKIKISPDFMRAKSILVMVYERESFLKDIEKNNKYPTMILEHYYEIIKELCTAIALTSGFKFIGEYAHKELIDFALESEENQQNRIIIQDLRVRRNRSSYEGKPIEQIYLDNHHEYLVRIIKFLKLKLESIL